MQSSENGSGSGMAAPVPENGRTPAQDPPEGPENIKLRPGRKIPSPRTDIRTLKISVGG